MINQEFLEKFKRLYEQKYSITLSDEEATRLATDFLNLMKVLTKPKLKKELQKEKEYEISRV